MNTNVFTIIFLILIAFSIVSFSGCERARQIIVPGPSPTDAADSVKIGIIQPSGFATTFSKGAELARSEINASGGVLGMPIEFIAMDNQGTRPLPCVRGRQTTKGQPLFLDMTKTGAPS